MQHLHSHSISYLLGRVKLISFRAELYLLSRTATKGKTTTSKLKKVFHHVLQSTQYSISTSYFLMYILKHSLSPQYLWSKISTHSSLPLARMDQLLLIYNQRCTKQTITSIAQSRDDITIFIQLFIDMSNSYIYIWMEF